MKINHRRLLKFLCIFQIICIAYFIILFALMYNAHVSPIYNTFPPFFEASSTDRMTWSIFTEEFVYNFIYFAILVKIVGLILSLVFYPDEYGDRKYNISNIISSVLDITCVTVSIFAFIQLFTRLCEDNPLIPVWFSMLNFAMPFLLFAIACILHFACVMCVFIKQRKNSAAIAVREASLTKVQKISLCAVALLACGSTMFSRLAPVAADKFIYGSDFKTDVAKEYIDYMIATILFVNDSYGIEIGETTELGPYFDFGSYTVRSTEMLSYDGNTISMQCVIYSYDNDEEYAFEFAGKRKWFGSYELEMTSDFGAVLENYPRE